jgi:hypothetical protein
MHVHWFLSILSSISLRLVVSSHRSSQLGLEPDPKLGIGSFPQSLSASLLEIDRSPLPVFVESEGLEWKRR